MYFERYRHSCIYSRLPASSNSLHVTNCSRRRNKSTNLRVSGIPTPLWISERLRLSRQKNNLRFPRQIFASLRRVRGTVPRLCFFSLIPPAWINFSPFFQSQTFYRFSFWSCLGQKHFCFPFKFLAASFETLKFLSRQRDYAIHTFCHANRYFANSRSLVISNHAARNRSNFQYCVNFKLCDLREFSVALATTQIKCRADSYYKSVNNRRNI